MRPLSMVNLIVVPPVDEGATSPGHRPARRLALSLITLALFGSVFGFWIWASNADKREIQALPGPQRQALFQRTVADLRESCDPAPPRSLRDFCRRQAELALKFHECDADPHCLELARRHVSQPRR